MAGCSKDPQYMEEDPNPFLEQRKASDNVEEDSEDDSKRSSDFTEEDPDDNDRKASDDMEVGSEADSNNTSDLTEEEPEENTRVQECVDRIREKLIMSDQMDKLSYLLNIRLSECGWKSDLLSIIRAKMRRKRHMKFDELYELIKEEGKRLVPLAVQREMICKIQKSYEIVKDVDDKSM